MRMAKRRMTRRSLNLPTFSAGYGELQNTLALESAVGFNSGLYGWNWDCYRLYPGKEDKNVFGVYIVTGYRNLLGRPIPYEMIQRYEAEAKELRENVIKTGWSTYVEKMNELVTRLVDELLEE